MNSKEIEATTATSPELEELSNEELRKVMGGAKGILNIEIGLDSGQDSLVGDKIDTTVSSTTNLNGVTGAVTRLVDLLAAKNTSD